MSFYLLLNSTWSVIDICLSRAVSRHTAKMAARWATALCGRIDNPSYMWKTYIVNPSRSEELALGDFCWAPVHSQRESPLSVAPWLLPVVSIAKPGCIFCVLYGVSLPPYLLFLADPVVSTTNVNVLSTIVPWAAQNLQAISRLRLL